MNPVSLLIVEDEAVVAADLRARLERNGHTICGVAHSGEQALVLARKHLPSLVLMDIRLQGELDGIQTAAILRKELNVAVVYLSAHSDISTLQRAKVTAPYGYLLKPFQERELQITIEVALERREAERHLEAADTEIRRLNAELEQRVRDRTAQLEEALAEIDNIAHAVAHHLRSPLRAMEGFSHLLVNKHNASLPEVAKDYPQTIGSSARQAGRLVDDLLAFLRLRQQPVRREVVNVAALAREVLAETVSCEPERVQGRVENLPPAWADPALVKQLLTELISNSLKFASECRPIIVTIGALSQLHEGDHVYFVRDNGIGFDRRYADKLFGLFNQLNLPEAYAGTGAGLAKARRIVELMGGRIWAEPLPDAGAQFFFCLPSPP